jgi:hypothetical protein
MVYPGVSYLRQHLPSKQLHEGHHRRDALVHRLHLFGILFRLQQLILWRAPAHMLTTHKCSREAQSLGRLPSAPPCRRNRSRTRDAAHDTLGRQQAGHAQQDLVARVDVVECAAQHNGPVLIHRPRLSRHNR